jgi:hypothetical protein
MFVFFEITVCVETLLFSEIMLNRVSKNSPSILLQRILSLTVRSLPTQVAFELVGSDESAGPEATKGISALLNMDTFAVLRQLRTRHLVRRKIRGGRLGCGRGRQSAQCWLPRLFWRV